MNLLPYISTRIPLSGYRTATTNTSPSHSGSITRCSSLRYTTYYLALCPCVSILPRLRRLFIHFIPFIFCSSPSFLVFLVCSLYFFYHVVVDVKEKKKREKYVGYFKGKKLVPGIKKKIKNLGYIRIRGNHMNTFF